MLLSSLARFNPSSAVAMELMVDRFTHLVEDVAFNPLSCALGASEVCLD